jgi:hypothetical protein
MKAAMLIGAVILVAVGVSWSPRLAQSGVREPVAIPLAQIRTLAQAGNYKEAMRHLDELQAMPDKTSDEITVIRQMREYVLAKLWLPADAQLH